MLWAGRIIAGLWVMTYGYAWTVGQGGLAVVDRNLCDLWDAVFWKTTVCLPHKFILPIWQIGAAVAAIFLIVDFVKARNRAERPKLETFLWVLLVIGTTISLSSIVGLWRLRDDAKPAVAVPSLTPQATPQSIKTSQSSSDDSPVAPQQPTSVIRVAPGANIGTLDFSGNLVHGKNPQVLNNEGRIDSFSARENVIGDAPSSRVLIDQKYTSLSHSELKIKTAEICRKLREFDAKITQKFLAAKHSEVAKVTEESIAEFKSSIFPESNSLLHALLHALKQDTVPRNTPIALHPGQYAGSNAGQKAADFLEKLAEDLT
jgi:hypothetical protein